MLEHGDEFEKKTKALVEKWKKEKKENEKKLLA